VVCTLQGGGSLLERREQAPGAYPRITVLRAHAVFSLGVRCALSVRARVFVLCNPAEFFNPVAPDDFQRIGPKRRARVKDRSQKKGKGTTPKHSLFHSLESASARAGGNAIGDLGSPPSARDRTKQHAFAVQTPGPKREKVTELQKITDILQAGSSSKSNKLKNLFGSGTKPGNHTDKNFHNDKSKLVSPYPYGVTRATPSAGKNSSRQMSAAKHTVPRGNFYGHSSGNGSSSSRCSRISSCIILLQEMSTCLCKS